MSEFLRIAQGVDVMPLLLDLRRQPQLWNANRTRTTFENSPHAQSSDIWVRFRAPDELTSLQSHNEAYRSVFWPAWHALPSLRPIVFGMMAKAFAVELGSILITRLAPGKMILPHSDGGFGWSPEFYNTKMHFTVSGASRSTCGDDEVTMHVGEIWTFDNLKFHSVESIGAEDRICVIVSIRCES